MFFKFVSYSEYSLTLFVMLHKNDVGKCSEIQCDEF